MYPKDIKKGITRKEGTDTKETSEIVGDRMKVGLSTGTREKNTNENPRQYVVCILLQAFDTYG